MNVVCVTDSTELGGAEMQMLALFRSLVAAGHGVRVHSVGARFVAACTTQGLPALRLPSLRSPTGLARGFLRLRADLRDSKADVVHAEGVRAALLAGCARSSLRPRPGLVMTVHNLVHPRRWSYGLAALLLRLAGGRLTTVAESERRRYLRAGFPSDRCRTVYNGVTLPEPRPGGSRAESRRALGLPEEALVVAQVGRLHRIKGHELLFEAVAGLPPLGRPIHVAIAGEGPLRRRLEQSCQVLGIASRVSFLGFMEDVSRVFEAADLLVQPSWSEAFPMALLEAMAAGVPVVATTVGGVPEMLSDGVEGWLIPPGDRDALRRALVASLGDAAERSARGRAARRRVERDFTFATMVRKTLAAYAWAREATA